MGASRIILLVDPDGAMEEALATGLKQHGFEVARVRDEQEALRSLAERAYSLVLSDTTAPCSGDSEFFLRLHQTRPGAPAIALIHEASPCNLVSVLRADAFTCFSTPFDKDLVLDAVERALLAEPWAGDIELVSAVPHWISFYVRCKMAAADRVVQILRELSSSFAADEREDLIMAFREMLMNAVEHGGGLDPAKRIYVSYISSPSTVVFYIRDPGPGFSMKNLTHSAIANPEGTMAHATVREEQGIRPGGFGIMMAKHLVDDLIYNERGNEVILVKHLRK